MSEPARRTWPIHPLLVGIFPVLAVLSANLGLFPLRDAVRPAAVALALACVVLCLGALLLRSWERGAIMATAAMIGLWVSKPLAGAVHLSSGWAFVAVVGFAFLGWKLSKRPSLPTAALNRFAILLVVVATGSIAWRTKTSVARVDAARVASNTTTHPDVFCILLDGYGRADQLDRVMGHDNSAFVSSLEELGFFVADSARSNYCQTSLSLASALNLEWMDRLVPERKEDRWLLNGLVDRPRIVKELRAIGYESIAVSTGFPGYSFDGFDLVVDHPPAVTYFESTLIEMTPFSLPDRVLASQFDRRREDLIEGFATLRRLAPSTAKPRFVFAHILAPHPPFVFDDNSPKRPKGTFGYQDGSDYMKASGSPDTYREGYVGQLKWVNRQVLETVTQLTSRKGEPPIVLVFSDHGSKVGLDQEDIGKTDLKETFSTLGAYFAPGELASEFGPEETPLAAMRKVFSHVSGSPPVATENRSYYSPFSKPYDFVDVTDRVR